MRLEWDRFVIDPWEFDLIDELCQRLAMDEAKDYRDKVNRLLERCFRETCIRNGLPTEEKAWQRFTAIKALADGSTITSDAT